MGRFCYCSQILPNKTDLIQEHWKNTSTDAYCQPENIKFWQQLHMTGFDSWLQQSPWGDFMIHSVEGESLQKIFKGLREEISHSTPRALKLKTFYENVLGKDYSRPEVEPSIENLLTVSLPATYPIVKRGFCFPLLAHKEKEHRLFRKEAAEGKRQRHEASLKSFGISHLSAWLQHTPNAKYIIVYTEGNVSTPLTPEARLAPGQDSADWKEIAEILMDHTGLKADELSPDVKWLTELQTRYANAH